MKPSGSSKPEGHQGRLHDINMPGSMDGLALAQAVRRRWPPVELVLTSGFARVRDEDMPERGLFLGKPYKPNELVGMIRSLIATLGRSSRGWWRW